MQKKLQISYVKEQRQFRSDSISVSIPACHAGETGSIPVRTAIIIVDKAVKDSTIYTYTKEKENEYHTTQSKRSSTQH